MKILQFNNYTTICKNWIIQLCYLLIVFLAYNLKTFIEHVEMYKLYENVKKNFFLTNTIIYNAFPGIVNECVTTSQYFCISICLETHKNVGIIFFHFSKIIEA